MKKFLPILLLPIALIFTGCDGGSLTDTVSSVNSYDSYSGSEIYEYEDMEDETVREDPTTATPVKNKEEMETEDSEEYIIKEASLSIEVKSVQEKMSVVSDVVKKYDGQIIYTDTKIKDQSLSSSSQVDQRYDQYGYDYYPEFLGDYAFFQIKVPVNNFDTLVRELSDDVGRLITENVSEVDVSSEVANYQARIKSETASLNRLEELLNQAENIDEILRIEEQIQQRKSSIVGLEAEQDVMKSKSVESTISVSLITPIATEKSYAEKSWFSKVGENIGESSAEAVSLSIVIILFATPLVLGFFLIRFIYQRTKRKKTNEGPEEISVFASRSSGSSSLTTAPDPYSSLHKQPPVRSERSERGEKEFTEIKTQTDQEEISEESSGE